MRFALRSHGARPSGNRGDTFGNSLSTNGSLCPFPGDPMIEPYQRVVFVGALVLEGSRHWEVA